jgi:hypothetical protein
MIPKVNAPELLTEFHSDSLCDVLYKTASNVMANRVKKIVLQIFISEEQSVFVPAMLIMDNILISKVGYGSRRPPESL